MSKVVFKIFKTKQVLQKCLKKYYSIINRNSSKFVQRTITYLKLQTENSEAE